MGVQGFSVSTLLLLFTYLTAISNALPRPQARQALVTTPSIPDGHWIDTWAAMPQLTEYTNLPPPPYNTTTTQFYNSTIRQTLHMSTGAEQIRIRISNAFGLTDLPITAMTVALPFNGSSGVSAIQPSTLQTVTFSGGNPGITIPNGALAVSDPLNFPVQPLSTITVTLYLATGQNGTAITSHPGSRATSWFTMGNQVGATNLTGPLLNSTAHWYFLSAVEAWSPPDYRTWAIIGDSITDGRGSDTDQNNRWPDLVYARMAASNSSTLTSISFINQAAGGNRILHDGLGPSVLSRLERDVLSHPAIRWVMIFEGVNDIGTADPTPSNQTILYDALISAYIQIARRVHAMGIPLFGATITPFSAPDYNTTVQSYSDPLREQTRQKVNDFIRHSGTFDAVLDFDAVLRNQSFPSQLADALQGGDYLHPNGAGYARVAETFDLGLFERFEGGVGGFL
ncbi:extracellular GDSL-like lipase/acylhydrolase [Cladophialophora carrionii]|uniref:Extracellular GDSL-like lipase/acylhydrolase n=1 Tax=Cladophialophora carrionii TaxID=86049 RepID=A0A1C1CRS0_9EURO|nr:extracellular GDSL-like lipase/acylhydrolase [Cladophialophora carrionii]